MLTESEVQSLSDFSEVTVVDRKVSDFPVPCILTTRLRQLNLKPVVFLTLDLQMVS